MGPLRGFIAPRERHIGDGEGVGVQEGAEAGACCALYTLRDKIFRGTVNAGSPVRAHAVELSR